MRASIERYVLDGIPLGWPETRNLGEARAMRYLQLLGIRSDEIEYQFKLGGYRLDFAFVKDRIDLEIDGWVHSAVTQMKRDYVRDRTLKRWGWDVYRVGAEDEEIRGGIADALLAMGRIGLLRANRFRNND